MADLQLGDVLLVRDTGIIPSLIRLGENVRYHGWKVALRRFFGRETEPLDDPCWPNHAAVYVGNDCVIEAEAKGLTLSPVEKYKPGQYQVAALAKVQPDTADIERTALVLFARSQLAKHVKYGWLSIATIVAQLLTPVKLDLSWDGSMICSAFAALCWEHAGVTLPTRSAMTTMPADLAAMVAGL